MKDELIIHTDGGARGNPGPAACAFVIEKDGKELYKASKYLGKATNNFAEYSAVILALNHLTFHQFQRISRSAILIYSDSELMVNQLKGIYKIKNESLRTLASEIRKLIIRNHLEIKFIHILRSKNKTADSLVNKELDENA